MPGKSRPHRAHTPIVSARQARFFGAEYGRAKAGETTKTGMSKAVLRAHLNEWAVKPHGSAPYRAHELKQGYRVR